DGQEIDVLRPLNTIDVAQVRYKIRREGDKTIYEMAFPLSALHVAHRGPGTRLGFSLLVNENDTGAREGYVHWSDGIGRTKNPEEYGQLLFAP
ncbi:MAG: sugar-binding protein, partial [Planctomycetota bacterium]